ncbi:MAG: hypothetical protein AAGB11_20700 [Pseudomonadota bacterium]
MSFRKRLRHEPGEGAYFDGDIRYMMIRPDALMSLFARLSPDGRAEALAAFGQSITEHGRHSASTYGAPRGDRALLTVIEATAADLGWGIWRFEDREPGLALSVRKSPFASHAQFSEKACHAIVGMCEAVGGLVLDVPCTAREVSCIAADGGEICSFLIEPTP